MKGFKSNRSVATPVATKGHIPKSGDTTTKARLHRSEDATGNTPPYKTWGKSRSIRLKDFDYSSSWMVYHLIIGANQKPFVNSITNQKVVEILKSSVKLYGYKLITYCLMPDHLHILVQAEETPKDLRSFVRGFKSFCSKSCRRYLWQRSFYEHILRKEENVVDVARYILHNPVRKDLVKEYGEYKWLELLIEDCSVATPALRGLAQTTKSRPHESEDATGKGRPYP
jgi:putative transposase